MSHVFETFDRVWVTRALFPWKKFGPPIASKFHQFPKHAERAGAAHKGTTFVVLGKENCLMQSPTQSNGNFIEQIYQAETAPARRPGTSLPNLWSEEWGEKPSGAQETGAE